MTLDITLRWAGPTDAASGSTYKIERTLDYTTWSELAAAQAATAPYASVSALLGADADYGATGLTLGANSLSASGYGWLDDALIQWTGKSGDNLTGVTWHSGYGTYASGSMLYEAHEAYTDSEVTPTYHAVVYRITHTTAAGLASAPAYAWYYYPPVPESSDHCVVIVGVGKDLGVGVQAGVTVTCALATDDQFADDGGQHLDMSGSGAANSQTTNNLGLAVFHCWKSSRPAQRHRRRGGCGLYVRGGRQNGHGGDHPGPGLGAAEGHWCISVS